MTATTELDRPDRLPAAGQEWSHRAGNAIVGLVLLLVLALVGVAVALAMRLPPSASAATDVMVPIQIDTRPMTTTTTTVTQVPAAIGNWTPERGRIIAERALSWLSWPYSFGGGNESGPTYGHPVDHDSRNDGRIKGFDCSGLVMFAVAPWLHLDHLASTQYNQAGSVHPALNWLQPGDLIFWSKDGTVGGIGHVAVYIGDGKVVQAPRSGAYVTVTRLDQVEPGRIGVTRPLT